LLLAAEWCGCAPATTADELAACVEKMSGCFWGDVLPWQLALVIFRRDEDAVASRLEQLTANLDHGCQRAVKTSQGWALENQPL
jgi:hypothetical protein